MGNSILDSVQCEFRDRQGATLLLRSFFPLVWWPEACFSGPGDRRAKHFYRSGQPVSPYHAGWLRPNLVE